jgi:hypothetical protein
MDRASEAECRKVDLCLHLIRDFTYPQHTADEEFCKSPLIKGLQEGLSETLARIVRLYSRN